MEQELTKKCSRCRQILTENDFYKNSDGGLLSKCKNCIKAYQKDYRQKPEAIIKRKVRRNKPKWKNYIESYRHTPKDKTRRKAKSQTFEFKNKKNSSRKIRMHNDSAFAIRCLLSTHLCIRLKEYSKNGKTKHASEYGINYRKICEYLKPTLKKRKANTVDHIISAPYFDLNNDSEIRLYHSAENLQWLPGLENFNKGAKIRQEDLLELQRRINYDKLDINILKQLIQLGEMIYSKEQNKASSLSLVAVK